MDPEKDGTRICIDDSEIMRELQCVSQLRWECWSVWCVWAYTGDKTQWQVSLLKLPRSVGRSVGWFLDLNSERKEVHEWNASGMQDNRYGLRWVCTYGTSHPGRWSVLESIDRYVTFGYTVLQQKYPGRVERN